MLCVLMYEYRYLEDESGDRVSRVEDHAEYNGEQGDGQHIVQAGSSNHQSRNALNIAMFLCGTGNQLAIVRQY